MNEKQGGEIRTKKFAYWTSMFEPEAPCFILKKIAWIETNQDFFFSCPEGNNIVLLVYCTKGKGIVYYGKHTFMLSQGLALIFNIHEGYRAESLSDDFNFIWVQMFGDFPNSVLEHHLKDRGHICSVGTEIIFVCNKIFEIACRDWSYEGDIRISYLLYELLGTMLLSFAHDETIDMAALYIKNHFIDQITTSQLAKICFLGTSQFIKRFKESYSITPKQYITNYRVDKAKHFLLNTDLPVSVISSSVGFEDASYFTRVFKKATGITPQEFRKSLFVS